MREFVLYYGWQTKYLALSRDASAKLIRQLRKSGAYVWKSGEFEYSADQLTNFPV